MLARLVNLVLSFGPGRITLDYLIRRGRRSHPSPSGVISIETAGAA